MRSENTKLVEIFEEEVLLYIDKQLDPNRMKFWDGQVSLSPELRTVLNETLEVLNLYSAESLHDIAEPEFSKIVAAATKRRRVFGRIWNKLSGISNNENDFGINSPKIAFGSLLVVASLVMLLLTDRPNTVKQISSELLDWDAEVIHEQMQEIDGGLSLIEDENLKKYLLYEMTKDEWSRDYYMIKKDIQNLIEETEDRKL